MKQSLWVILQSLPNLCKGCFLPIFTQVEFYKSQNFQKSNSKQFNFLSCMQEKLQNCASKCATKRLWSYVCAFFPA